MAKRLVEVGRTIYGLSTGAIGSKAAISVVRISGPNAFEPFRSMVDCDEQIVAGMPNRKMFLCNLQDPVNSLPLDRALCVKFSGPNSFTGEDMLELHLHGGVSVTSSVLEALGSLPDFRMSYKGEFTRRSYENNKMNLLEVEALSDLVNADTDEQRVLALRQLNGDGAEVISGWRQSLISARSNCEALLDFGEEESDVFENPILFRMVEQIENLREDIDMHIRHQSREIVRDGIRVTIVGPTNAGKSSLLNCLLNRDVSIVTDIPGTTRDIIESSVDIDGLAFKFSDSAGIRHSVSDPVEKIGIQLAKDSARSADIRVFVLDIAAFLQQQHTGRDAQTDLLATMKQLSSDDIFPDIIVINKADLIKGSDGLFSRTVTGIPPPRGRGRRRAARCRRSPCPGIFHATRSGQD